MNLTPTLRDYLREETRAVHRRAEAVAGFEKIATREAYRRKLERYYAFMAAYEPRVAEQFDGDFNFALCSKLPWLEVDLRALGTAELPPPYSGTPFFEDRFQALGSAYVLEGAIIGGQVIAKALRERLGIDKTNGGRFFHGYGAQTRERWREFVSMLNLQGGNADVRHAALCGAKATFIGFAVCVGAAEAPTPLSK